MRSARSLVLVVVAPLLAACTGTSASVTRSGVCSTPRDQAAVVEVVQDLAGMPYELLGHVCAGGNVRAFEAMERVKVEARRLGADAITNVRRVDGGARSVYEADAIRWAR